uniref:FAS1 domain-containing protein n=1 Tax=Moniliophthora roreri TaxID=221103 RepID=A0A0W0FA26_MONRR
MYFRSALFASLVAGSVAQGDLLGNIAQALNASGLSGFAGLLPVLNSTTTGQAIIRQVLSGGNFSFFVPTNDALSAIPSSVTSDAETLARIVSYHVLKGNFTSGHNLTTATLPEVTIGRTLLNDSNFVHLEGNRAQVLVWGKNAEGQVQILNQPENTTVQSEVQVGGFAVTANNVNTVIGILNNTQIPVGDQNQSFTSYLDSDAIRGFTFFVPNDAAIQAASAALQELGSNPTLLLTVLGNHIINGTTLYSTTLTNSTSASGEPLTFHTNSTGTFVTSGNSTARIVNPNVLLKNGVAHIIDTVLANTQSNPQAAQEAASQAAQKANQTPVENGPIQSPAGGGNGSAHSSGNSGNNGVLSVAVGREMVASIIGMVVLGVYLA